QGKTQNEVLAESLQRYQVEEDALLADLERFDLEIRSIGIDPDQAPLLTDTGFDALSTPEATDIPLRVNLCLTDRWNTKQNPRFEELTTEQWKTLIRKTFDAGIPQIIFIGGEPTLRQDLVELLHFAEELGMVTGLLSASPRLYQDPDYLDALLGSGLDHLIIEFDPHSEQESDLLQPIFNQDLFTCVRFPVHRRSDLYAWSLKQVDAGANALSFYAAELDANDQAAHLSQQLTNEKILIEHDLPFPLLPAEKQHPKLFSPEVSEHVPVYYTILPDGSLTLQDFPNHVLGSLLTTDWQELILK
ncbi:MAG: radical SAM protein, partial [Anaerolineaceae bacterium]|nr:radical SAM protein [Anaerolineaceae bacterium]